MVTTEGIFVRSEGRYKQYLSVSVSNDMTTPISGSLILANKQYCHSLGMTRLREFVSVSINALHI